MDSIRKQIQDNMDECGDDYTLKTNDELIDIISNFGCGELEFHTADIERLLKENEMARALKDETENLKDMCRFLAHCFKEVDSARGKVFKATTLEEAKEIAVFNWPVIHGTVSQMKINSISNQPYSKEGITNAFKLLGA